MKKLSLLLCLSLMACDQVESLKATEPSTKVETLREIKFTQQQLYIWVDPSTKCKYYYTYGGHQGGLAIRYTKDGLPDCPKQESKP